MEKFKDARVHYAVLKQRTNPPERSATTTTGQAGWSGMPLSDPCPVRNTQPPTHPAPRRGRQCVRRPVASGPNSVLGKPHDPYHHVPSDPHVVGVLAAVTGQATLRQCSTHEQPPQTRTAWAWPLPPPPDGHEVRPGNDHIGPVMEMSSLERR